MAKIQLGDHEIDEEDVRKSVALRSQIETWMRNPAAKRKLLEARKAAEPDAKIPELDQPDPVEQRFAAMEKQLADERKAREEAEAKRESDTKLSALQTSIETGIEKLRREQRLTDEGVVALRKIMDDEGIVKPDIAWAVFQQRHPPADPITPRGHGAWNFMDAPVDGDADADAIKELLAAGNDFAHGSEGPMDRATQKLVRKALADTRAA
jgi:hypothetical protein